MKDGKVAMKGAKEMLLDGDELKKIYGMDVKEYMKKQLSFWK